MESAGGMGRLTRTPAGVEAIGQVRSIWFMRDWAPSRAREESAVGYERSSVLEDRGLGSTARRWLRENV